MSPRTIPNKGLPPKRVTADHPIRAGKKAKAVLAIKLIMLAKSFHCV